MNVLGHRIILSALLVLFSSSAFADESPIIIYFGGAASKKAVLDRCFPSFRNFGYPVSKAELAKLTAEIRKNSDQKYILAGHSSGSRYAIDIAKTPNLPNRTRLTVVDLDGFSPYGIPKEVRRVCWNAADKDLRNRSRNFSSMGENRNCGEVHTHITSHCEPSSNWCLHFAMVNPATPANLRDWTQKGYDGCSEESLPWLQRERVRQLSDAK